MERWFCTAKLSQTNRATTRPEALQKMEIEVRLLSPLWATAKEGKKEKQITNTIRKGIAFIKYKKPYRAFLFLLLLLLIVGD